jgi:carbon starvation protein CstA
MNNAFAAKILWLAAALLFVAGCATTRVDWDARVGTFTYDQAVEELGPPDKQAKLTNNQTVAEWISRYSTGGAVSIGTGIYGGGVGGGYVIQPAPTYRESKLRLTFGTNNVLSAWSRN